MRFFAALAALLMLAGCDAATGNTTDPAKDAGAGFTTDARGFDYRYAFRLPSDRVKAVQRSNAAGCDQLGPARCRIIAERYHVSDTNQVRAELTLLVDPSVARVFGDAAVKTLQSADGVLVNSDVSGADTTAAMRSLAMIDRLNGQLKAAQSQADGGDAAAKARADRIKAAIDTIAEVEASQGQTLATAPMIITYESSNALTGLGSADANFRNAGQTLETTLSRVLIVLAAVGPWLLALILLVLVLRFVVHGRGGGFETPEQTEEREREEEAARHEHRSLISRWFNRDDEPHAQPQPEQHG